MGQALLARLALNTTYPKTKDAHAFAGMTLPFSFTYANAAGLIKESHVRANFGFSPTQTSCDNSSSSPR